MLFTVALSGRLTSPLQPRQLSTESNKMDIIAPSRRDEYWDREREAEGERGVMAKWCSSTSESSRSDGDNEDEREMVLWWISLIMDYCILARSLTLSLSLTHTHTFRCSLSLSVSPPLSLPLCFWLRDTKMKVLPLEAQHLVIQTTSQMNSVTAAFDSSFSTICCQIPGEALFFHVSFVAPALLASKRSQLAD